MAKCQIYGNIFGTKFAAAGQTATEWTPGMKLDNNLFNTLSQIRAGQYQQYSQSGSSAAAPQTALEKLLAGQTQTSSQLPTAKLPTKPAPADPATGATTAKPPTRLDFTQMSKQQLSDWLAKSVKAGTLSNEQQSAFQVLAYAGETNGTTTPTQTVEDFRDKAKSALQSAIKRKDSSSIQFWAGAMSAMKQFQGEKLPTTST